MPNIVALGDATTHGTVMTTEPVNTKVTYGGIQLCLLGAIGFVHVPGHVPIPLLDVIVGPINTKVTYSGIPFAIYGAVCSCGAVVCGSNINPKVFIN